MELVKQKCEGMSLLYGGCHPLELPDSAGTVAVGFNLPPAMPWKFGPLRARPALDCGAPLRSPCCAGLGGLTPPYAFAPSAVLTLRSRSASFRLILSSHPFPCSAQHRLVKARARRSSRRRQAAALCASERILVGEVKVLSKST